MLRALGRKGLNNEHYCISYQTGYEGGVRCQNQVYCNFEKIRFHGKPCTPYTHSEDADASPAFVELTVRWEK